MAVVKFRRGVFNTMYDMYGTLVGVEVLNGSKRYVVEYRYGNRIWCKPEDIGVGQ